MAEALHLLQGPLMSVFLWSHRDASAAPPRGPVDGVSTLKAVGIFFTGSSSSFFLPRRAFASLFFADEKVRLRGNV